MSPIDEDFWKYNMIYWNKFCHFHIYNSIYENDKICFNLNSLIFIIACNNARAVQGCCTKSIKRKDGQQYAVKWSKIQYALRTFRHECMSGRWKKQLCKMVGKKITMVSFTNKKFLQNIKLINIGVHGIRVNWTLSLERKATLCCYLSTPGRTSVCDSQLKMED